MTVKERHAIEIEDADNDRAYWQCDCGMAGSAPGWRVDIAAEKHVPQDAHVVYRHSG